MRVKLRQIFEDIIIQYNLQEKATSDGYVYIRIEKGMHGLQNAAILAYKNLKDYLGKHGYAPIECTVGMWKHTMRKTRFCVCVDDFGIKHFNNDDIQHLFRALQKQYAVTVDWDGKNYCELYFDWHYDKGYVDISMPNYILKALKRLQYQPQTRPQFSPNQHIPTKYGRKGEQQFAGLPDSSNRLTPAETTHLQSIIGTLLYHGRSLEYAILPSLNTISSE